jgi:hypothetical protein
MSLHTRLAMTAAAAAALIAGCTTNKDADRNWQDPNFPPAHSVAPTRAIFERQYAAGAVEDGMFYPVHFDGDALNGLGEQKLRAMAVGRPANTPLRVYLNLPGTTMASATRPSTTQPTDAQVARRQASLERALAGLGLEPGEYAVATGPNPDALRPADAGVRALQPVGAQVDTGAAAASGATPH